MSRVPDAPSAPVSGTGLYFDGASARPHPVALRLDERLLIEGGGIRQNWSLLDVRADEAPSPVMRVRHHGRPDRVEFADADLAAALAARCPDLRAGAEGEGGARGLARFVLGSLAAGALVLLAALYGVPFLAGRIAPLVPAAVEARFGEAVERQVAALLGSPAPCEAPAGRAVLDRLVARLTDGAGLPGPPIVTVRRHDTANALTLPGNRVVVLSGLLAQAKSADEFAGVLGHEFGHVAARDPTRAVITAGGVSFLLGLVLGDVTGSTLIVAVGEAAVSAGHSRDAERAADAYGVALMTRAGGDPAALAAILERIDGEGDDPSVTGFLRSHPYTRERATTIRRQAGASGQGSPILTDEEWRDLRAICPQPPAPRDGKGRRA